MSRTRKGTKGIGFDFQSRRPGNRHGVSGYGPRVKRDTHKRERQQSKRATRKEVA